MPQNTVLAIDLGAESGRVMAVTLNDSGLSLREIHRFPNLSTCVRDTLTWDFLHTWHQIQRGIDLGKEHAPLSLGIDTWGVDFGLLDKNGDLLGNPVHYRDERTLGIMEWVFARVPKEQIFEQTGIQFMPINTLYQLASLAKNGSPALSAAETLLFAPDLINYWLTGRKVSERTIASTSQMVSARSGDWARELLGPLGIPQHILPPLVEPGTHLGTFRGIDVIAPACHDTGSAVAGVPARDEHVAYISSGTWSLVGIETAAPVINRHTLEANLTNEAGVAGTTRLLRNVGGLWLLQQCRAAWHAAGYTYTYPQLVEHAARAPALRAFIDPNAPRFLQPGDFPALISTVCRESRQHVPQSHGEIVRCILQSLALCYRETLQTLISLTERRIDRIHIVGGGSQNHLLCQMTADATGLPVQAGPVEATVLGNALLQMLTLKVIPSLQHGRKLIAAMPGGTTFIPAVERSAWDKAFARFQAVKEQ